ncbi:hypothetical protein L9F63_005066, partial [Diploptera punctata]
SNSLEIYLLLRSNHHGLYRVSFLYYKYPLSYDLVHGASVHKYNAFWLLPITTYCTRKIGSSFAVQCHHIENSTSKSVHSSKYLIRATVVHMQRWYMWWFNTF